MAGRRGMRKSEKNYPQSLPFRSRFSFPDSSHTGNITAGSASFFPVMSMTGQEKPRVTQTSNTCCVIALQPLWPLDNAPKPFLRK